jgi:hypothetical protein
MTQSIPREDLNTSLKTIAETLSISPDTVHAHAGGPKVRDLRFQSMSEKGRLDLIIETNRCWPELLAFKKES